MYVYYHNLNPVFLKLGEISIYYYGLVYFFTLLSFWYLFRKLYKKRYFIDSNIKSSDDIDFMIFCLAFFILIFARFFHFVLYDLNSFAVNPIEFLKIWHGGMSSIGGFIGLMIGIYFISKYYKIKFFDISDNIFLYAPIALAFGRIANLINGELVGRLNDGFFLCIDYSKNQFINNIDTIIGCRYPSQIFEVLKNILLFLILFAIFKKYYPTKIGEKLFTDSNKYTGRITIAFFIFYSILRIIVEFYRSPDSSLITIFAIDFTLNQIIYEIIFLFSIITYIYIFYFGKKNVNFNKKVIKNN